MMQQESILSETIIRANDKRSIFTLLKELYDYRLLLVTSLIRDIKVRYTQTVLGLLWMILSPIFTVGVFTFVFGVMIKVPSEGLPYLLFYLVALIPWYAFMSMLNCTVSSLEGSASLISKIYFPRIVFSATYHLSAMVDYLVGCVLITVCALIYGFWNYKLLVMMPFFLLFEVVFTMGLGLALLPFATRYRDVKHILPLALQFYYFANPILYPMSAVPKFLRPFYDLNPMATIINGYRDVLRGDWPDWSHMWMSGILVIVIFLIGLTLFNKKEQSLVDLL